MYTYSDLPEHHALLIYALENVDEAIFLIDENARFVMVNEKACRSLGYTREELLNLRVFDIDPDFTHQDWIYNRSRIAAGRLSVRIETRHKTKEGRIFPVEVCANYISYEGRHYDMALVRDISERKETEKQLALLNYAIDHVGEAAWLIDENAKFHYNNAEARRAVGYSREELLNMSVPDIDPDYQLDIWPAHWQDLKENHSLIFETRHQRNDGHIFPVEVNANYFEFDGKAYNLALIRDISERKQAQEALQRSEKMLAEAQRIAAVGSWDVDFSNNMLTWSAETYRIWELEKSQFDATLEAFYDTLHPEDRAKVIKAFNNSVENKTLYQIEHRLLFPDGRIKYIAERGEPFLDENGNITHFVGTAMDITEQQHINNTLEFIAQRGWKNSGELFLNALAQYLAQIFGVDYVVIDKVSETTHAETVALYAKGGIIPNMLYKLEGTPCNKVINGELCTYPKHVQQLFPNAQILIEMQAESYIGFPLWNTNGEVIGLIAVLDTKPMHQISFITSILQLVVTSVTAELERQRSEQVLLDSRNFFKQIINTLADPVFVKDREHRWLLVNQAFCDFMGTSREELHGKTDYDFFPDNQANVFWNQDEHVLASGIENVNEEEITTTDGTHKIILTKKTCYTDSHGQQFLVGIITDITERKNVERQLEYHASYDLLTGLPNRRMFNQRLHIELLKAKRRDIRVALLFIDLDNFKEVNDILGHKTGDYLLVEASKRIQNCVRQTDIVARLGGDEFVTILPEAGLIPPLERIAGAMIEELAKPFQFAEHVIYISGSIGIAVYPQDADDVDTLIACADQAMYAVKESGRNSFHFFTRSMQEQAHERLMLINNLRLAIEKEQLHVYYQPIVDVSTGKIVKAEALVRWIHPTLGMVSPAVFIPIAEETNLIQEIGTWVFHQAAKTAQQWNLENDKNKHRKISINMSPRQLLRGEGEQMAIEYLQQMNINPNFVVIEITEGILLDDSPHIIEKLEFLQAAGIELSLDDFGTGYSAIAYLKKFNLDYLKIDRSFIKDLETQASDVAIAKAIIVMAQHLGLKIVAEGVETQGQRDLLATAGCHYIQGYFYAKPMPKEEFLSFSV